MSNLNDSVHVDPDELRRAADRLDAHASEFLSGHQRAHSAAGQVRLGAGLAGAALPEMLAGWEADGVRFHRHFSSHAEGHRTGAAFYVGTEDSNAGSFGDSGL